MRAFLNAIRKLFARRPAPRPVSKREQVARRAELMRQHAAQQDTLWGGRWSD